ncbi:Vgr family protein, partial [Flavobacterium psychrophilum]|nr:Vgr family protein [Flavobacterium psychrophilum]
TSSNNTLKIGSVITIEAQQLVEKIQENKKLEYKTNEIGTYIITEITHKATDIGEYENSFKALPAFIKKLPEPQITFPQAQMQQAIVVDNADPKGNGRVRVQLLWQQTKNLRTPWLRVMTPDAGTSGEVATNRGMVFIPEVGDHVMLGFRYNDPNRPFVIGSLFNGTIGAGGSSNNNIKSIFTRTGSTITFDEGQSSILVKDPSGNIWFMDGNGNINVTAPKTFSVNATDINLMASQNVSVTAGMNISESAGVNKATSIGAMHNLFVGGNSLINVTGNVTETIMGNLESHTEKDHVANSKKGLKYNVEGDVSKHSQKDMKLNSSEKSNLH